MTIAVKYCGGCNSRYDRRKIFDRLRKDFGHNVIHYMDAKETPDYVVVICGCESACPNLSELTYKKEILTIQDPNGYDKIKDLIVN